MTKHDADRRDRALNCDQTNLEEVEWALVGLQSTDDPELVPLYNEFSEIYRKLKEKSNDSRSSGTT